MRLPHGFAVGAMLFCANTLAAQASEQDVHLRNDCRLAAQVIRTGHPAPHAGWAYSFISRCPESGAVLATGWDESPGDETSLQRLNSATYRVRTREVFEAASRAARDVNRAPLVRIYALSALYSLAEPGAAVLPRDLLDLREDERVRMYTRSGDGDISNPLGDVKPEVEAILSELIASGGNPQVVRAATALQQLL